MCVLDEITIWFAKKPYSIYVGYADLIRVSDGYECSDKK